MALSLVAVQSFLTRASLAAACLFVAAAASGQQFPVPEVVYRVEYKTPEGSPNSLMQAADGHFYGTTSDSYAGGPGALFRLRPDGLYSVLHRFTGGVDGGYPSGRLVQATDGRIYGMTGRGGRSGFGTIFWMAPEGRLTTLHDFTGADGAYPSGELIQAEDGHLYGVTSGGGASDVGTAFQMSLDGSLRTIHHFERRGQFDPTSPALGLVEYAGAFYGIVSTGWRASVYRMSRDGAAVTFVYDISLFDGDYSMIGLNGLPIKASDGNLYGTTQNSCKGAKGAFYRITPDAAVLELREFPSCAVAPFGRLIEARDGSFLVSSRGSVLRLTRKGEMTELGETPGPILLQSASGDLYGAGRPGISLVRLGVPVRVRVSGRGPVWLIWSPVPGASSYTVKRTSASGEEVVLGRVTTTSFMDQTAVPGQRYVYSVSSTTSYGDSAFSSPATALANRVHDVDGDGRADLMVYSPVTGYWWSRNFTGASGSLVRWGGVAGDIAAPGDYDGDGALDLTIFRPSTGTWYIRNVETAVWGQRGDTPVPGDYNGDGVSDLAVYRRTTGTWYIRGRAPIVWGGPNDIPVAADFDGDGAADIAVYRPDTGVWFVRGSTSVTHGIVGDIPIPADYDGDGMADFAVFRRTTGTWHIKDQATVSWGAAGDVPVALDRDGDGRVELGVYRRRRGDWYFKNLATGQSELATLGGAVEDVPIGRGIAQEQRIAARAETDFDADGRDDVIVFRPSSSTWFMRHSDRPAVEEVVWALRHFDNSPGWPLALDFNGDGLLDVTEVKTASWQWSIKNGCCAHGVQLGAPGDIPVPGDYNADGGTDAAVFRPATGTWYIVGRGTIAFGGPSDIPVPADYDGDGMTDLAVYRAGTWFIRGGPSIQFGEPGDIPVPADYDADGIVDIAVYRPATGTWDVRNQFTTRWGSANDVPMPLDRDGDGRAELNVYRPSTGTWHFYNPVTGAIDSLPLGAPGDIPVGRVRLWAYGGAQSAAAVAASSVAPSEGSAQASAGPSIAPGTSSVGPSASVTGPVASGSLGDALPADAAVVESEHATRAAARASGFRGHDVDGDGKADVMVYRPRTGEWWIRKSSGDSTRLPLGGMAGDVAAPGDYNGDGVMDPSIFRPDSGNWHISGVGIILWGRTGDVPVPADYDGDGVTNVAVYRPSTGVWYIKGGGNVLWGQPGDLPVPADYDGDGVAEIAVFRPTTGVWYVRGAAAVTYGVLADIPVPADYDGDGAADIAVFRPSSGTWFVKDKMLTVWGRQGDVPVPLDRDGDGQVELGVFRRGTGVWYFKDAAGGSDTIAWGGPGDVPIGRGMFPWHSAFGKFDRDFDRDGRDDLVVFRPWSGTWRINHSNGAPHEEVQWGIGTSDLPVPGDYDGDGLTDLAVFEQNSGTWLIRGVAAIAWGQRGDVPVPADYDGDGITDIAVYRPSTGLWSIRGIGSLHHSRGLGTSPMPADVNGDGVADVSVSYFGSFSSQPWDIRSFTPLTPVQIGLRDIGCASPVAGDMDGDGDTDFGHYLCESATWHLADGREVFFGSPRVFGRGAWDYDVPLMLDRDGDGRAELGFFRPETGTWRFKNLVTGATETVVWGQPFSREIPLGVRFESPVLQSP